MGKTILVIEDQEQNLYLMKYMLEANGYKVILARDGEQGLTLARTECPDLILLDIQLPTINGYEVAQTLKSDPNLSAIPIVAVTSYAMPGDRKKALSAGCTGYIEKPIDPESFLNQINNYMKEHSSQSIHNKTLRTREEK